MPRADSEERRSTAIERRHSYDRERYAKLRALGLCGRCGRVESTMAVCKQCADTARVNRKRRRAERRPAVTVRPGNTGKVMLVCFVDPSIKALVASEAALAGGECTPSRWIEVAVRKLAAAEARRRAEGNQEAANAVR